MTTPDLLCGGYTHILTVRECDLVCILTPGVDAKGLIKFLGAYPDAQVRQIALDRPLPPDVLRSGKSIYPMPLSATRDKFLVQDADFRQAYVNPAPPFCLIVRGDDVRAIASSRESARLLIQYSLPGYECIAVPANDWIRRWNHFLFF